MTQRWFMTLVLCIVSMSSAHAHVGEGGLGHSHDALASLVAGALHPWTGLDHLAAMVSVGLWSALRSGPKGSQAGNAWPLLSAPLAFAVTLLAGALLGRHGVTVPGVEPMVAASLLAMGLLVGTRLRMSTAHGAALVAGFALFHGLAHGPELAGQAWAALAGMVAGTLGLHALGLGAGLWLRERSRWVPRFAGAGVAALGLGLLAPAIAAAF